MTFAVSPLTRKRWLQFRRNRRAWGSLRLLAGLYILSLGAELLCNDQPLLVRVNGRTRFPFLRYVPQDDLFGNGVAARPDYDRLARDPAFRGAPGNRLLRAPVPYGPHQVADPATLEAYRRATLTVTPDAAIGRLNLAPDGTIARRRPDDTRLVYGYAEMPDLAVVPSLTVEYGVDGDEALYSAFGLAYEREIAATLTVELTGSLAWANAAYHRSQFDADQYALGDATLGASLTWSPSEPFSITASLLYSTFVSETISDAAEASGYDAPDAMVAGLTLGYAF